MQNADPGLDIYSACKIGNFDRVVHLIDVERIPINEPDQCKRTGNR